MSKLTADQRRRLLVEARSLSPDLGKLFEGESDISMEDLDREIAAYHRAMKAEKDRWEKYYWKLGDMLCFPENNHKI